MRASRDFLAREQKLYSFNNAVLRESVFYDQYTKKNNNKKEYRSVKVQVSFPCKAAGQLRGRNLDRKGTELKARRRHTLKI